MCLLQGTLKSSTRWSRLVVNLFVMVAPFKTILPHLFFQSYLSKMVTAISRIGQLYRCTRGVPFKQLARRGWPNAKRRANVSPLGKLFQQRIVSPTRVQASLRQRLIPPRNDLVRQDGCNWHLTQLGAQFSLQAPVDWRLVHSPGHTHLQRLSLHYHEFMDALPFSVARGILLDWIKQNPKRSPGYWLDNWNCYAISIRCVCWMHWLEKNKTELCTDDQTIILTSLADQVNFLTRNLETDICGNHLIKNIRCLLWGATFFEGPDSTKWRKLGERLLWQQLPIQILPDGMHFELSPAYHCQVFIDLLECVTLIDDDSQKRLIGELAPMAAAISDLTHPDGLISLFSDGGLNMAYAPVECLDAWERVTGKQMKPKSAILLAKSGYYGVRFGNNYFLADAGPICADALPAHGHADQLSFEWSVAGRRLVVDAGAGEYESGARRNWGRSSAAHNTVTVDNRDQAELIGSFRIGRRSTVRVDEYNCEDNRFHLKAICKHQNRAGCVTHQRIFQVLADSVMIHDQVDGTITGDAISRVLLHHECQVEQLTSNRVLITLCGLKVEVIASCEVRISQVDWSPNFGVWIKTTQLEFQMGQLPCKADYKMQLLASGSEHHV